MYDKDSIFVKNKEKIVVTFLLFYAILIVINIK